MREIKLPSKSTEANIYDDKVPEINLPGKDAQKGIIPDEVPPTDNSRT